MRDPIILKSFNQLPSIVQADGLVYSIRLLERNYNNMRSALDLMAASGMDAKQCHDLAVRTLEGTK